MKALGQILLVLIILYVTSYIVLRSRWTHRWEKDGKTYMHFPVSPGWVYYVFRPMSIVDSKLSSMQFHIGPHPGTETEADTTKAPGGNLLFVPPNDPIDLPQLPSQPSPVK